MTPGSLTPLQLDPLGGLTARRITLSCVGAAVLVAVLMSIAYWDQVAWPGIQVLALLALLAASALMVISTSPYRAPLSRGRVAVIWSVLALASLLDAVSQWGATTSVRDNWGPVAFAIVILMTGSYRSAREILRLTIGATIFLAILGAIVVWPVFTDDPARFVGSPLVMASPVLATGIGAAVFSRTLVVRLLSWRGSAASAQRDVIEDLRSGLVPSVRNERIEMLNADVVPFLSRIVELGELRAEDSDRARELAGGLRAVMLPEAAHNWLESVVREVVDPEQLAERMGNEQRASLKALLHALGESGLVSENASAVRVRSQETTAYLQLTAPVLDASALRTELAPYFVVARSFFPEASIDIDKAELLLELHYSLV